MRRLPTKYLTAAEAAERLGVNDSRIRILIMEGRLPRTRKFGNANAIHPLDLQDYMRTKSSQGAKPGGRRRSKKDRNGD